MARMWLIVIALASSTLAAGCEPTPDTGKFVANAGMEINFQIEANRLALTKAFNPYVKRFAQQMLAEYEAGAETLKIAAAQSGANAPKPVLDEVLGRKVEELRISAGPAFDQLYMEQQLKVHEETVKLYSEFAEYGEEGRVKQFAKKKLVVVETHLSHVRGMNGAPIT